MNTDRFGRTKLLLGAEAFERLTRARVVVAGLGAVGSYAVEGLARAGVGALRIVDGDVVRPSNINRQLYALDSTLGRPKVEVAAARIRDINPACRVEALQLFVDSATCARILEGNPDAVIDAIDSLGPKVELATAAYRAGLKLVSVMGAATRTDPAAIRVADLADTRMCPLARFMRKRLQKRGIERGIRCVFSTEPAPAAPSRSDAATEEEDSIVRGRKRRPLGSLSCLTGIFGLIAAREALALLVDLNRSQSR
jgi:tRNA A37 threonylcarbamoyladenosine dehydratase